MSPAAKKRNVDRQIKTESTESVTDFSFFRETLVQMAKKISWYHTSLGFIRDQFSSEWCNFLTTITRFNQVIHHNDKVKPKQLSSFTLRTALS